MLTVIASAAVKAILPLAQRFLSPAALEWAFFWAAQKLVDHTETKYDDQFLSAVKAAAAAILPSGN